LDAAAVVAELPEVVAAPVALVAFLDEPQAAVTTSPAAPTATQDRQRECLAINCPLVSRFRSTVA
jgi:hypothetical protein